MVENYIKRMKKNQKDIIFVDKEKPCYKENLKKISNSVQNQIDTFLGMVSDVSQISITSMILY